MVVRCAVTSLCSLLQKRREFTTIACLDLSDTGEITFIESLEGDYYEIIITYRRGHYGHGGSAVHRTGECSAALLRLLQRCQVRVRAMHLLRLCDLPKLQITRRHR